MSRRRIVIAASLALLALSLMMILPGYFSPVPALVAELKACIEPVAEEERLEPDLTPDREIVIEFAVIEFNTTRAGTRLLTAGDQRGNVVCGLVSDAFRFNAALVQLQSEGCIETLSVPRMTVYSDQHVRFSAGQPVKFTMPGGGVVAGDTGTGVVSVATLGKDGRIRVQLDVRQSDPKEARRPRADAKGNPELAVAHAKASVVLRPEQTGIIGGAMRRYLRMEEYRLPLASDLPALGDWFRVRYEAEIDEQLVILVTPRLVALEQ